MARVFICYRRNETKWVAGRIFDRLAEAIGRDNIFLDVSSIEPGEDFVSRITDVVGSCDVLIAVIGPAWLTAVDRRGLRRIDDARDLVRIELAAALHRKIRVIPVLVDGAVMPEEHQLPEPLMPLATRNAHEVSFARFHADVDSFTRVLQRILTPASVATPTAAPRVASTMPFTLSLETLGGAATPLITKGARLPAQASEVFSTAADDQGSVEVSLSIGNRPLARDNVWAGKFQLHVPPAPRGVPQIRVQATVDPWLILTVTAEDLGTKQKQVLDAVDLARLEVPDALRDSPEPPPVAAPSPRDSVLDFAKDESFTGVLSRLFGGQDADAATRLDGADLQYDLELTRAQATNGTEATLEVRGGRRLKVRVPAGVQAGQRLRLRGEGEPGNGGGKPGDLYIKLHLKD